MKSFFDRTLERMEYLSRPVCFASGINDPVPAEWNAWVTQTTIALEVIPDVLYDTLTYTSAVTNSLVFFQQVNVKQDLTNMRQAGLLPNPESFLIQAPRIYVKWTPTISVTTLTANIVADITLLFNTAIVTMQFGNKNYGPYPAWMFSAGGGPDVRWAMAGATAADNIAGYAQLNGPLYGIFPHLMIAPLQSFNLTMSWPSGPVTLGAGNPAIQVVYDGQRARAVN